MTAVTEIRLPQFGMGMQEGTIIAWRKREGDQVAAGEVVAEIEAEKVTEELVATGSGVLQRILVPEGETVAVNELLAVIGPAGAVKEVGGRATDAGPGSSPGQTLRRNDERDDGAHPVEGEPRAAAPDPVPAGSAAGPAGAGSRRQVTPRARRLAADLGVDLDSVVGTGPGGRVTEDDVAGNGSRRGQAMTNLNPKARIGLAIAFGVWIGTSIGAALGDVVVGVAIGAGVGAALGAAVGIALGRRRDEGEGEHASRVVPARPDRLSE